ncbi:MAG TPA: hypothetical protein VLM18_02560 [Croceibacterium sp.]|nr:hypothetical protein [Croceibacterium sp.]
MFPKHFAVIAALALPLAGCHDRPHGDKAAPEPTATAAPVPVYVPPTPAVTAVPTAAPSVSVMTDATPCGAEKLQNYLNLMPTSTAKDEIARTLGHSRIRYVPLQQAKAQASPASNRLTAGVGADGRIKEFSCG